MDILLTLLDDLFFAAIPAVGFALIFNVPPKALKYCATLGALGHCFRTVLVNYCDVPVVFSTFFAAALIGFIGVYLSQRFLAHPKVFTVAAIIPMIPGVYAYKAMIAIVQIHHYSYSEALLAQALEYFIKTGFILAALVFGLALPGQLFYRRKPVV
ncbi:membrane protein [Gallibacterium genomosp. 2]|uniref:Membrane protein n=2 Tax=Gallibacterium TaxID=155493 RepID=A0A0A2XYN8_9PAST|nr:MULTISPECIES: threonine/serine exporter family protein [Gallibacterium]KGQ34055.1 membrane protein [Gallibacterium genomosp. 2]KGQ37491.1 membrane protein [Gallibacterium genomosp. 1]OBW98443.1 membrane protein [Gallibacterium genomosp. 1]OBX00549.1 membrane protein [Gallibacterium genomosp. 1]